MLPMEEPISENPYAAGIAARLQPRCAPAIYEAAVRQMSNGAVALASLARSGVLTETDCPPEITDHLLSVAETAETVEELTPSDILLAVADACPTDEVTAEIDEMLSQTDAMREQAEAMGYGSMLAPDPLADILGGADIAALLGEIESLPEYDDDDDRL